MARPRPQSGKREGAHGPHAREGRGLSRQEVARQLGVERSVMPQYEAGTIDLAASKPQMLPGIAG